ncbi:MAG: RbcX chaperonin protein [Leptolyngbyaceae cyanobacterium SM2_5_2]|nr:RbcX chaperonin protein [Leptolyngbyaceae cyanobacterium SM2_5_2]
MDLKQSAKDAARVLTSYITYQAVTTVLNQLKETNPAHAYWLNSFSTKEALQNGETYLNNLLKENVELAMRIMTVRQHIAESICEFLPEMVVTGIQQANMEHRRQLLEHITQLGDADHALATELLGDSEDSELPQSSVPEPDSTPE